MQVYYFIILEGKRRKVNSPKRKFFILLLVAIFLSVSFGGSGYAESKSTLVNNYMSAMDMKQDNKEINGKVREGIHASKNARLLIQSKDKNSNWKYVTTDANGNFQTKLTDGNYTIKAIQAEDQTWFNTEAAFSVEEGSLTSNNKEIQISNKKKVSSPQTKSVLNVQGKLSDGERGLKGDLLIFNMDSEYEEFYTVSSKGNGTFAASLPDGNYLLFGVSIDKGYYQHYLPFTVEGKDTYIYDEIVSSLDIQLPKSIYKGSVKDSTKPISQASIILEQVVDEYHYEYEFIEYVITDNKGNFHLRKLEDGLYTLSIYHQTYSAWEFLQFEVVNGNIVIEGNTVPSLEITIPDLSLKGTLSDGKKPVTNAYVTFAEYDGEEFTEWYGAPVNKNGQFEYRLNDGFYQVISVDEATRNTYLSIPFEIRNGKLIQDGKGKSSLNINLPPVTFTGKLIENGKTLDGHVYVERKLEENDDHYESFFASTDTKGLFSLRLTDGFYSISGGYIYEENGDFAVYAPFEIRDGKLYVDGKEQSLYELNVPPISLHGVVLDGGVPVNYGDLVIATVDRGQHYWKWLEADGTFSMRLADGNYLVESVYLNDDTSAQLNVPFTIRDGKLYQNNNLQEKLVVNVPPITLTGLLLDEGEPVSGGVEVMSIGDADEVNFFWSWAEDGAFKFRLPDGEYEAVFVYISDGTTDWPAIQFSIVNGQLYIDSERADQLEITVAPVTLRGTVFSGDKIVKDGYVAVLSVNDLGEQINWYDSWVYENGTYKFRLPDGDYQLYYVDTFGDIIYFNKPFTILEGQLHVDGVPMDVLDIQLLDGISESEQKDAA
ncbi:carboxypeptidase-like regulatory domain-containing protein [Alkalihalobacterium chitinilyticum]|uniref:Carboxypeptidase-like regulatory domain-containing protein n=1 Tax=Alkalihalobacterium chitinilyticum TaxID=2980103 RepID=A0ABT5VE17_9BACI|nr:carboxypeptidase-like regulatory domain-containing protein [Alkalihalobacterium chitinilyticum]MDE5413679.1 carboxypeptidase-like regulatory domain-containing protein [Alkalihalobacterium chitinilyticum]